MKVIHAGPPREPGYSDTVYIITCKITGKSYVGVTNKLVQTRFLQHLKNAKKGRTGILSRAVRKYGEENFSLQVLCDVWNRKTAYALEEMFIKHLKTKQPFGYNMANGGEGGFDWTPKRRKEQSLRMIGNQNLKGHIPTKATRKKISDSIKGRKLILSDEERARRAIWLTSLNKKLKQRRGVCLSLETRRKLSEARRRTRNAAN